MAQVLGIVLDRVRHVIELDWLLLSRELRRRQRKARRLVVLRFRDVFEADGGLAAFPGTASCSQDLASFKFVCFTISIIRRSRALPKLVIHEVGDLIRLDPGRARLSVQFC